MQGKELTYAYNAARNLVYVDSVPNGNNCGCFCPKCGEALCARNGGNKRMHHFSHISGSDCPGAYERMLHLLAKDRFYNKFYSEDSFFISFQQNIQCSETNCKYRNSECDSCSQMTQVNLKDYYDTCEKEKSITKEGVRYVADLLLTNSQDNSIPHLLIEIFVSHRCEDGKINSGLKILEFNIQDEDSLESLLQKSTFTIDNSSIFCYGFKDVISEKRETNIQRLIHIPGKPCFFETIPCCDADNIVSELSDLEVNVFCKYNNLDKYDENKISSYLARQFSITECAYCQHYECHLYCEKTGVVNPQKPFDSDCFKRAKELFEAASFERYCRFEFMKRPKISNQKATFHVIISASKFFCNDDYLISQCEKFLSDKLKTHEVIVVTAIAQRFGGYNGDIPARKFAKEYGLIKNTFLADWDSDGKKAAYLMYEKVFENADALIYFSDGKEPQYIVAEADRRKIPYRVIDYSKERRLCPKCGSRLIQINSKNKRDFFWGCACYPDCNGTREANRAELEAFLHQYEHVHKGEDDGDNTYIVTNNPI